MIDKETVIQGLECCSRGDCTHCPYWYMTPKCKRLMEDALLFLKAQEPSTVEPRPEELEPETKAWLDKMNAIDTLHNIADICVDWDGYRTADGLGGLINEIWAYARYCAQKCQEPKSPITSEVQYGGHLQHCPSCGKALPNRSEYGISHYCYKCGQAVK